MRHDLAGRLATATAVLIEYLALTDPPAPADVIWGLGSNDVRVAETAAALYRAGRAPWVLFSGGRGHRWTDLQQTEADLFAAVAAAAGVPSDRILIENRSSNTGENILFSLPILDAHGLHMTSALLITIPPFQRRASLTLRTHRPALRCINQPISWGAVADWDEDRLRRVARLCAGEIARLQEYPRRGFIAWDPAELPDRILRAAADIDAALGPDAAAQPPAGRPRLNAPAESATDRFLRYVQVNTQSRDGQPTIPSTPEQWDLARLLVDELRHLGVSDVRLSDSCIVYATLPSTITQGAEPPVVGLVAHVDTSPALSGANVRPVLHRNYQGGDIVLPADRTQVISAARNPSLRDLIGDDIITTDGTTLLGSDKAGLAAIMTMVDLLAVNPAIPHGRIAIAFTADEEVGAGTDTFDLAGFGATVAYTVDGDALGEINHETWSARAATVTFRGVSSHPGTAKGVMVNAAYAMADFVTRMPSGMRPETTEGRVGFMHAYSGVMDVELSTLKILLRDFDQGGLDAKEQLVRDMAADAVRRFPGVNVQVGVEEQDRNMNDVLEHHPVLVQHALEAARRAGLTPVTRPIRGGTDGARLTFLGLPCPNIFTGGHNFHSKLEFNSRRGLEKTAETLVYLVEIFAEHAGHTA